jgi:ABC-type polysaccharide/polyol phosphate export permease
MKAIIWRELKINYATLLGIANKFIIPLFPLFFFAIIFNMSLKKISFNGLNIPYLVFFSLGMVGIFTYLTFSFTFAYVRLDNRVKLIETIVTSKTSLGEYFIGKFLISIGEAIILSIFTIIIFVYFLSNFSLFLSFKNIFFALLTIIISSYIWFSLGFISGTYILRDDVRDLILGLSHPLIIFLSPVYYSINDISILLKKILLFNPLTHTVNALRNILINNQIDLKSILILSIISFIISIGIFFCLKFKYREL